MLQVNLHDINLKDKVKKEREALFGKPTAMKPMMLPRPTSIRRPEEDEPIENIFVQDLADIKKRNDSHDSSIKT